MLRHPSSRQSPCKQVIPDAVPCLTHQEVGANPIAYECPGLLTGRVIMPSGYLPGTFAAGIRCRRRRGWAALVSSAAALCENPATARSDIGAERRTRCEQRASFCLRCQWAGPSGQRPGPADPVVTQNMPCCWLNVNRQRSVACSSPCIDAELVKPAASLSFQCRPKQGLLEASANFLNCRLTMPMLVGEPVTRVLAAAGCCRQPSGRLPSAPMASNWPPLPPATASATLAV